MPASPTRPEVGLLNSRSSPRTVPDTLPGDGRNLWSAISTKARNIKPREGARAPLRRPVRCPFPLALAGRCAAVDSWLDLRMARPSRDDLFDVAFLLKEAERYRSEAREAASERERNYLLVMSSFSETMAANEKMRAWLERSIKELTSGDWLEATGKRQEVPGSDPTSPVRRLAIVCRTLLTLR